MGGIKTRGFGIKEEVKRGRNKNKYMEHWNSQNREVNAEKSRI